MSQIESDGYEDLLVGLLADYDQALAEGRPTARIDRALCELNLGLGPEWEGLKECLELLHRARPERSSADLVDGIRFEPSPSATAPNRLGRFIVERELGRGGLGVVYLAHDPKLNRRVALKVPRFELSLDDETRKRFLLEAEAAARVSHPNLVTLLEVGEHESISYLASEFCPGPNLAQWIARQDGRATFRQAAEIVRQLAEGVQHAHTRGVLHRDIKPSNVLMVEAQVGAGVGTGFVPKLTDFGLAKLLERSTHDRTHTGTILGTLAYIAPEQLDGRADQIDARTDVYALGAILYELLTGVAPYTGDSDLEILRQLIANEATLPRKIRPDVPRDLEAIALKCLASSREARYLSAGALAADLRRFLDHLPTAARPLRTWGRVLNWTRRRPTVAALWLVTVLGAASIAGISALRVRDAATAAKESDRLLTMASDQRKSAADKQSIARRVLYASRMRAAQQAWRDANLPLLRQILQEYALPQHDDLRHFEWHHLNYLAHLPHRVHTGHSGEAYAVVYSPDGEAILTGGEDGTVRIWDSATGEVQVTLHEHSSCVNTIDFSPDGDTFATASCDKTIKLWSLRERRVLATLTGHSTAADRCAFIDDGKLIASLSRDTYENKLFIWDVAARTLLPDSPPSRKPVGGLAVGRSRRSLLAFVEGEAVIWTVKEGVWKVRLRLPSVEPNFDAVFSPEEDIALVPRVPRYLKFLRLQDGQTVNELNDHMAGVKGMAFRFDGKQLATASGDGSIGIFSFPSGQLEHRLLGHVGGVWQVAWSPSGNSIASVGSDGTLRTWNLEIGSSRLQLMNDPPGQGADDLAFLSDGQHVTATYPKEIVTWNIVNGQRASLARHNSARPNPRDALPDDAPIAELSNPLLTRWDPRASLPMLRIFFGDDSHPTKMEFAARILRDGLKMVEIRDGKLRSWNIHPLKLIDERLMAPFDPLEVVYDISLSGTLICGTRDDGSVEIRNLRDQRTINLGTMRELGAARFSPQEDRLLIQSNPVVQEFDVRTGNRLRQYFHRGVTAIAYSADAQRVAIASELGYIAVHDAMTGEEVLHLDGAPSGRLLFAGDGASLVADGAPQGGVYLWPGRQAADLNVRDGR